MSGELLQPNPLEIDQVMPAVSMLIEEFSQKGMRFPEPLIQMAFLTQTNHMLPAMILIQDNVDQDALMTSLGRLQYREADSKLEVVVKNDAGVEITTVVQGPRRMISASTSSGGYFVEAWLEDERWQFASVQELEPSQDGETILFLDPPTNPQVDMLELRGIRVWESLVYPGKKINTRVVGTIVFDNNAQPQPPQQLSQLKG